MIRAPIAALAIGVLAASAGGARAQCCEPLPASRYQWQTSDSWGGIKTWIGATEDGWVHVVVRDRGVAGLATSSDAGQTFGFVDSVVTEGSNDEGFGIAADGTLLLGYQRDGQLWFRRSTDHGMAWSPAVALGPMAPATVFPHPPHVTILTRPNGLCALLAVTNIGLEQEHSVYVSSDFGETWLGPQLAVSPFGWFARLALTDTTVAVASQEAGAIVVRRTTDGGLSWTPPVAANAQALDVAAEWIQLVSTGANELQLLYPADLAAADFDVRVAVSLDDGASWSAANDSVIGTGRLADDMSPFAIATRSGGLVAGGWLDAIAPGVQTNFSSDRGLPGTWLASPTAFAVAGRAQHDFVVATLADDSVVVAYDDYREDGTAACPGGICESIYMSRSCPGTSTWQETRIDEDTPPNGTHSEEAAIAATSVGRLHVAWLNVPTSGNGVVQLRSLALEPTDDVPVTLTLVPAADCLSATQTLGLDSALLDACPSIAIQWRQDGVDVPGGTTPTLVLDAADIDGVATWDATLACDPSCPFATIPVTPTPFDPAAPLVVTRTDLPAQDCHPARVRLEAQPIPAPECAMPIWQWYRDGSAIPGARSLVLDISSTNFPVGTWTFRLEGRCFPARSCGGTTWPDQIVVVEPNPFPFPENVGAGLRVRDHGDPHAADVTAILDWTRDEGLPRMSEHHHVLRGTSPTSLAPLTALEPLVALETTESTPASTTLPFVHYYSVLAANACDDLSLD